MVICDKHKKCGSTKCGHKVAHEPAPRGHIPRDPQRVWESPLIPEEELTCSNATFFCYYFWDRVTCIPIEDDGCGVCEEIW
jgi:hypothetical protein